MKKGFLLALLMVAMLAIAVPASAMAPTIHDLPSVVIGDAGDVATVGTDSVSLLRYTDIIDLASPTYIETNNGDGTDKLHVYYSLGGVEDSDVKASGPTGASALLLGLNAGEIAALDTGSAPAAKDIFTANNMLSLIVDIQDGGRTAPGNAYDATVAANGATTTIFLAAGQGDV
jgi:hypothetical protein